jgi:hypothetical protein
MPVVSRDANLFSAEPDDTLPDGVSIIQGPRRSTLWRRATAPAWRGGGVPSWIRGAHRLTNDSAASARVLAMTEPPWSEAPYDDSKAD